MGRLQKKKYRAHVAAAKASNAAAKKKAPSTELGAAAVAATFGDDEPMAEEDGDDEHIPVDNEQDDDDDQENKALSRGQRKRMKKRDAFMRKMGLVNRVVQEKAKETKKKEQGAFAGLEELQASLFVSDKEVAAKLTQATNRKTNPAKALASTTKKNLNGKQRKKLAVRELGHLKAVHTHPSFQGDPFAAIQMHLQNTVVQANQENLKKTTAETAKKQKNQMDMDD